MPILAGRLTLASRAAACALLSALAGVAACSSEPDAVVRPATIDPALAVLDLSNGPVVAEIKSAWLSSQCLTIPGAMSNGARAELAPCAGLASQTFEFTSSGEVKTGGNFCLDPAHGSPSDPVYVWECHGGANQKWSLTDRGEITGIQGTCVSFRGHPDTGEKLYVTNCHDGDGQKWIVAVSADPNPTPTPTPVGSVSVSLSSGSVTVGQSAQANATVKDDDGQVLTGRTVSWTSSSPTVAAVTAAGLITAVAAGTTNITATSDGKSGSAELTVTAAVPEPPAAEPPHAPPASCSLVSSVSSYPTSSFSKPGYRQTAIEPDFRTPFMRITGDPGTPIGGGVSGNWPSVARLYYAKDQPWSADGKLFMVSEMNGAVAGQLFLDGDTFEPLFARWHPGPEARWHPTVPDVMIYVANNGSVGHWNPRTNASSLKFTTSAYRNALLGPWEGNPSGDGRYVAVTATRSSDSRTVVYVADLTDGTKGPDLDVSAAGVSDLDWASVSQGGGYVVLFGRINGATQTMKVYDRATMTQVAYYGDHPFGHFDLGIDVAGNEVAFGGSSSGPYSKRFIMRRLDNGQVTPLTPPTTWDWHASTRAYRRPGWGLGVTNDAAGSVLDREIYWVKLDGSGTIQRLGHHRTTMTDYNSSPFAVPSPDGKRVAFGSNWGASGGRPVQLYVIDTRSMCP